MTKDEAWEEIASMARELIESEMDKVDIWCGENCYNLASYVYGTTWKRNYEESRFEDEEEND